MIVLPCATPDTASSTNIEIARQRFIACSFAPCCVECDALVRSASRQAETEEAQAKQRERARFGDFDV